jgi:hypothetical protein
MWDGLRWTRQRRAREMFAGRLRRERIQRAGRPTLLRTAKPCGPGARGWRQAGGGCCEPTGFHSTFNPPAMEARRIRLQGERGISRQTIAQGMPACLGCTCMLVCAFLSTIAHETAGAASTRHSLCPLTDSGHEMQANLGRSAPRERGAIFSCRHLRTQAIQHPGGLSDEITRQRHTGYPAVAAHDGG